MMSGISLTKICTLKIVKIKSHYRGQTVCAEDFQDCSHPFQYLPETHHLKGSNTQELFFRGNMLQPQPGGRRYNPKTQHESATYKKAWTSLCAQLRMTAWVQPGGGHAGARAEVPGTLTATTGCLSLGWWRGLCRIGQRELVREAATHSGTPTG